MAHKLLELCIESKGPEEYVFGRPNGKRVMDFSVCGQTLAKPLAFLVSCSMIYVERTSGTKGAPE